MSYEINFEKLSFGTQIRKSPFSNASLRWGARFFFITCILLVIFAMQKKIFGI